MKKIVFLPKQYRFLLNKIAPIQLLDRHKLGVALRQRLQFNRTHSPFRRGYAIHVRPGNGIVPAMELIRHMLSAQYPHRQSFFEEESIQYQRDGGFVVLFVVASHQIHVHGRVQRMHSGIRSAGENQLKIIDGLHVLQPKFKRSLDGRSHVGNIVDGGARSLNATEYRYFIYERKSLDCGFCYLYWWAYKIHTEIQFLYTKYSVNNDSFCGICIHKISRTCTSA